MEAISLDEAFDNLENAVKLLRLSVQAIEPRNIEGKLLQSCLLFAIDNLDLDDITTYVGELL